jgi:hypothetical protein
MDVRPNVEGGAFEVLCWAESGSLCLGEARDHSFVVNLEVDGYVGKYHERCECGHALGSEGRCRDVRDVEREKEAFFMVNDSADGC